MAPPFLKKRTTKEASSRKLSVRIRSDQKETKQQRERRRAAISTGSANIRDEDMLAHGVSEDIVASFAVKEKKADVPQWMLDLKTPVKRPKLPLPGFYHSPDELKPQACIDEWARVSHASMGSTGVLTDVLSPLDFDAATDQSRSFFREEASRAIIQRKKELVVDTFIPKGSILYDDWEGGVSRRKNKAPNKTFKRRAYYFSLLQKRRLDSLHGAGSGEYARLLLELTGNADAALRSELERERERRLQALIVRVKLRMLTEHFEAFVEYMRRCFYVKEKFAKMLAGLKRLTFLGWKKYAYTEKRVRKLRIKVFMHLQLHVVETWRAVTDLNMERRRWFHDWKENADKQMKQRNKIGDFLMCNHLQKRFSAWAVWTKRIKAAKRLAYRVFGGSKRIHYYAWRDYTKRAKRIRHFMKLFCGNHLRDHYEAWRDFTVMSVKGRRLCGYLFAKGQKRIFIAWRRQCQQDRAERLRAEAERAGDDLVARFYAKEQHAALHRKPLERSPVNRVRHTSSRRLARAPPGWDASAEFTYIGSVLPRPPPKMPRGGLTPQATPAAATPSLRALASATSALGVGAASSRAPAPAPAGDVIDAPAPRFSILRGWSQPTTGIESKYAVVAARRPSSSKAKSSMSLSMISALRNSAAKRRSVLLHRKRWKEVRGQPDETSRAAPRRHSQP